jgi:putative solute:sodium symporter small subunit
MRLTAALLLLWFGVTFGIAFFARDLDFDFFGWPFSFWVASQGALLVYLLLVGVYALAMQRLDAAERGGG